MPALSFRIKAHDSHCDMKKYGLIGYPLGHSFSERWFREKFAREGIMDCSYTAMPIAHIGMLPELLAANPGLRGLNVTIPYKEAVMPYLTRLDDEARQVGAVNCVKIENGELTGYNTDVYGFRRSLLGLIGDQRPDALVLGSGGAAKAVAHVLRGLGMAYRIVSRRKSGEGLAYDELTTEVIARHPLIVNTTPLGTYPAVDGCPALPYDGIGAGHFLYDLVYNPPLTRFLAQGAERGAATMNGERMLVGQAERSWEIWLAEAGNLDR